MDLVERVETDSLVDMQVAITEEEYVEAVGEPQDDGSVGGSGDGMPQEPEVGHNEPPLRTQLVQTRTSSRSLGTAKSLDCLYPLWAPYRDQWKLAPR